MTKLCSCAVLNVFVPPEWNHIWEALGRWLSVQWSLIWVYVGCCLTTFCVHNLLTLYSTQMSSKIKCIPDFPNALAGDCQRNILIVEYHPIQAGPRYPCEIHSWSNSWFSAPYVLWRGPELHSWVSPGGFLKLGEALHIHLLPLKASKWPAEVEKSNFWFPEGN